MRTFDELEADLSSAVYTASVRIFEEAEHRGLIHGNGHHMAQAVARAAVETLRMQRSLGPKEKLNA